MFAGAPVAASAAESAAVPGDPPSATASPDAEAGRRLLAEAEAAMRAGDAMRAVFFLRQAHAVDPDPRYIANLGVVYERIGEYGEAAQAFEQYIASDPPADKRAAAEAALVRLRPEGVVVSTPAGARVTVDGSETAGVTPLRLRLAAGAHALRFERAAFLPVDAALRVEPGTPFRVEVALAPEPVDPGAGRRWAGVLALAGGGAAVVGAGVLGWLTVAALDERDAVRGVNGRLEYSEAEDRANLLGVAAIAVGTAGIAAIAGGAWLLATLPDGGSVEVLPAGGGVVVGGRF
jgi:tetratricopeptide (TPR) repeat protein